MLSYHFLQTGVQKSPLFRHRSINDGFPISRKEIVNNIENAKYNKIGVKLHELIIIFYLV